MVHYVVLPPCLKSFLHATDRYKLDDKSYHNSMLFFSENNVCKCAVTFLRLSSLPSYGAGQFDIGS